MVYIGDSYCDDENNNLECNYDSGDCCGPNVNMQYCTDCQCHRLSRDRQRFFDQVGHQTTYASIGNKYFFTK